MIASAPSKTALATSLASARVGRGAAVIDSSIWVATIDGTPRSSARRTSCFWIRGTVLVRHLDAEVAAGDHHRVGDLEDRIERLDGRSRLDLGDDRRTVRPEQPAKLDDVLGVRARTTSRRSWHRSRPPAGCRPGPWPSTPVMTAGRPGWPHRPVTGSSRHERPRFGRPPSRPVTRSSAAPSARKIGSPIRTSAAMRRYETSAADASPGAPLVPDGRSTNGLAGDEVYGSADQVTQPDLRAGQVGQDARGSAAGIPPRGRPHARHAACEAGVPCEKLIRATSIPASASALDPSRRRRADRADQLRPTPIFGICGPSHRRNLPSITAPR